MTEPRPIGSVSVSVVPDARDFVGKLREDILPGSTEVGRALGDNIGDAMYRQVAGSIDKINARLTALGAREVDIRVDLNDNGSIALSEAKIAALGSTAGSSNFPIAGLAGGLFALGPAAVAAAAVAIPSILAIGAAATGAIAGLGVLGLGFSGIGEALSAADKPRRGGGGGGGSAGGGSTQIADQQRAIQARQATQSAADQLTQATRTQARAERDLHDARVQALADIKALDDAVKNNALDQAQASINLAEAKKTLAQMLAAPGANLPQYADQIAQARLNVATAQQKANELAQQGKSLAQQDSAAHKAGVEGSQKVKDAKQALIDANHKLAEAQQNVTDTAVKNQLATEKAGIAAAGAAGGVDQFGQAMAKLNPIQQQFVEFLLRMKPLLEDIKLAASQFLPGLEAGITAALPAFGPFLEVVRNVAVAMGDVFTQIGKSIGSPEGQRFFTFLSVELPKQIHFLGGLFIEFGRIFANIFQAAAPLIDAVDQAILGFLGHMAEAAGGSGLKSFFDSFLPLVPKITAALTSIGTLVGQVFEAIQPAMGPALDFITLLATQLAALAKPVLIPLAHAFGDLLKAVSPLIPLLGHIVETILPPLTRLLDVLINDGVAPLAQALADALTPILPDLTKLLDEVVAAVTPFVQELVKALVPILPSLVELLDAVVQAMLPMVPSMGLLLNALIPLLQPLAKLVASLLKLAAEVLPLVAPAINPILSAMPLLAPILRGASIAVGWVIDKIASLIGWFDKLLSGVKGLGDKISVPWSAVWSSLARVASTAWNGIKDTFKGIANGIIAVINDMIGLINSVHIHVPKVHIPGTSVNVGGNDVGFDIPTIPQLRYAGGPVDPNKPYIINELGPELFIPKTAGTMVDAASTAKLAKTLANPSRNNYFTINGQSDPVATAHATANRFAARGV